MIKTATNKNGDKLAYINGQWVPVEQSATNQQGQKAYKVGGRWIVDEAAPEPPQGAMSGAADYAKGLVDQAGQGLTLGFSDEAGAALAATFAAIKDGAPWMETYQEMVAPIRQDMNQFAQENPIASMAANIAGAAPTAAVGIGRAVGAAAPGIMRSIGAGTAAGAAEGGIAGAGYAEPGERLQGAGVGAAVGGAVGGVAGPVSKFFQNRSAVKDRAEAALKAGRDDSVAARYVLDSKGKLRSDPLAIDAISRGFDEGTIATVKAASPTDRRKMLQMVNVLRRGKNNRRFAATNRASDVVGKSVGERFGRVVRVNKAAGKKLDEVANTLKGRPVDYDPAVNQFLDDLDKIGVKFDDTNATVSFADSDIEGAEGAINLISKLVNRARSIKEPDAYKIHRLKRFIDEQVSYGKTAEGLTGRSEVIVKRFRANLDKALDSKFPNYKMVNDTYADTIGVIDELQTVAGQRMDLLGPNADKAVGTLSRRILSKAQSRVNLIDALDDLERVAVKYGGKYDDDLMTQVVFVDELESLFGSSAPTSFQGDIEKAGRNIYRATTPEGRFHMIMEKAQKGVDAVRGKEREDLMIESIRRLLQQGL